MVVHPQQRSVGIGTRLLRHAIQFAEMEGLLRITLLTDRCNEAAQRFISDRDSRLPIW
jgi:ribosomal protein S18 acetylase RimI-like enzyme